jgi:hypothetical protein
MSRVPLILAIVLLLLPVLYMGSYLALVVPGGQWALDGFMNSGRVVHYRNLTDVSPRKRMEVTEVVFWPLEQIDRKVRPGAWHATFENITDGPFRNVDP